MNKIIIITIAGLVSIFQVINCNLHKRHLSDDECSGDRLWTIWFDLEKQMNDTNDNQDDVKAIMDKYPKRMCHEPFGIQVKSVNNQKGNMKTNWEMQRVNTSYILLSFHSINSSALNLQVRYCCPLFSIIDETTKRTNHESLTGSSCGKQEITPKHHRTKRIVGGTNAIPNSWPWMIHYSESIDSGVQKLQQSCGGTLISKNDVLTAAHCIRTRTSGYITLTAGAHVIGTNSTSRTEQRRTVSNIHIHPDYENITYGNDIAILRVNPSFELNKYVQPACLSSIDPKPNDEVIIAGWGMDSLLNTYPNLLKQAHTQVVGDCSSHWSHLDESRQICVADSIDGNSGCLGDSGGPILIKQKGRYVVSGVFSYLYRCVTKSYTDRPNVYTRVSAYKKWINEIIR